MSDDDRIVRLDLSAKECALISLALSYQARPLDCTAGALPPLPLRPADLRVLRDVVRKIEREVLRAAASKERD